MTLTPREKYDLGLAVLGSVVGATTGYFVKRQSHPVVGTVVGLGVGLLLFPAVVEVATGGKR
jgi:hypothetical protein